MIAIGGYFELELRKGKEFHPRAIALNTARNALELILQVKKYKKVYLPFFTCEVILEPFKKTNTPYEFYCIDKNLEPVFQNNPDANEAFLYTNYFGIKDSTGKKLKNLFPGNLIIDNSQSFFSLPEEGVPTFYSCRKFFGVPDGAYLYMDDINELNMPFDHSEKRFSHLLKRIEYGAETGYLDFKTNDKNFIGQPIQQMSKITKALLCNIDYEFIRKRRRENFIILHERLEKYNKLTINISEETVPLVYPFLTSSRSLKQILIENKIFVATYWPNVTEWTSMNSIEYRYASEIIPLPIDQRYDIDDMKQVIKLLSMEMSLLH